MQTECYSTPSTVQRTKSQTLDPSFLPSSNQSELAPCRSLIKTDHTMRLMPNGARAASTPPERPKNRGRKHRSDNVIGSGRSNQDTSWLRAALSKKKSQFYEDAFAVREPSRSSKSRAAKDSLIVAEIKTNHSLRSDQELLIDIACLLSEVYQRPIGCITVLLNTGFAILFDHSQDPAYQVSITALSSEIAPMKNKRIVGMLRDFMLESIGIPPNRGMFLFNPMLNDNVIAHGLNDSPQSEKLSCSNSSSDGKLKATVRQRSDTNLESDLAGPSIRSKGRCMVQGSTTTSLEYEHLLTPELELPSSTKGANSTSKARKRKSILALFGR